MKWFKRRKHKKEDTPESGTIPDPMSYGSEEIREGPTDELQAPRVDEPGPDGAPEALGREDQNETEAAASWEQTEEDRPGKKRWGGRLRERLRRTRERFSNRLDRLLAGRKHLDVDILDELEEILITSDLGVRTSQRLLQHVTEGIKRNELGDAEVLRERLREDIRSLLTLDAEPWDFEKNRPFVIMAVGVNGVGKTTTVGKLAHRLKQEGHSVMLVAADTFRAAAVEQLILWGERAQVPVVHQKSGSDPSAVAFDAIEAAVARNVDVVLLDTAGRMHTKTNLMEELKKIHRVIAKKLPGAPHEILLVLDATTGQNALSQARQFKEGVGVTGLILTKLDGTAKGGIITAICEETGVPVRFIGIGEDVEDLSPFDPEEFSRALF
ncbi:MAG: signal recognition particle-docking protein FtsY [Syntrophobacteraceae bacterium]|nr:signal recognition particle-docking protein FtsY [Syntrophobacteraceae bacterium]